MGRFAICGRGSYRCLLDFQKLWREKKRIMIEERSTMRKRRVPGRGVWTYFRYSWIAARMNRTPRARKIPPITSSHNWRRVLKKSEKIILNFPIMGGAAVILTATNVLANRRDLGDQSVQRNPEYHQGIKLTRLNCE